MSIPSQFKVEPIFFKRHPVLYKALWTAAIALHVAVFGFLGFVTSSTVERPPTGQLVDLGLRLEEARAGDPGSTAAGALDRADSALELALRSIETERRKPWKLRSYDRARSLVDRAEQILDGAEAQLGLQGVN